MNFYMIKINTEMKLSQSAIATTITLQVVVKH